MNRRRKNMYDKRGKIYYVIDYSNMVVIDWPIEK